MTGHGWGESTADGISVTVDVTSVNRKQSELVVLLPRHLESLETPVREEMARHISRGRVAAKISLRTVEGHESRRARVNTSLARAYVGEFKKLARDLQIPEQVSLDTLLHCPGVLQSEEEACDAAAVWPAVSRALKLAMAALISMREREGKNLAADLGKPAPGY